MKTVLQIAQENNISPQAVYKRINKMTTKLTPHIHKDENGKTLIDLEGERILTEGLNKVDNQGSQLDDNQLNQVDNQFNVFLQDQIKVKDQTIADLIQQNTDLIKKIENMQVLLKAEQEMKSLPLVDACQEKHDNQEAKRNIFQRLFGRKTDSNN